MRILFLLPSIHERPTGGNLYNKNLIEALSNRVHVRAAVWNDAGSAAPDALKEAIADFDVALIDSLLLDDISPILPARAGRNARCYLMVHYLALCDPNGDPGRQARERKQLTLFDGCLTTSRYSKRRIEEAGVRPSSVQSVYPGIDAAYLEPPSAFQSAGACRLLTVSSLLPGKGLPDLIGRLEELEALHWRWTLVGDGSIDPGHAAIVRERIERSPLSARMTWKGALDAAAMPACYRSHDLFVLPSAFETLSMATREALASGLPVIANRVGGIPENLLSGGGVLANPTERENLTLALRRLIEHPALRSRLRAEALSNRVAYSTWAETGGRLLEALGQMAGS